MIATTYEQSARLLQCGVPAESADMARYEDDSCSIMEWDWTTGSYGGTFPAFSLSRLLELLPPNIEQRGSGKWWFEFFRDADGLFYAGYREDNRHMLEPTPMHTTDPIEALMPVFRWLNSEKIKLAAPICHNATVDSIVEMIKLLPYGMKDEIIEKLKKI